MVSINEPFVHFLRLFCAVENLMCEICNPLIILTFAWSEFFNIFDDYLLILLFFRWHLIARIWLSDYPSDADIALIG